MCRSYRRARACPSPCIERLKKRPLPLGLRTFFVLFERSRGTGPRATGKRSLVSVGQDRQILTCSASGDPELLRFILIQTINIAEDRPRATVRNKKPSPCHRRARACPSPCIERDSKRPLPLGLRTFLVSAERSRGTGPRATIEIAFFDVSQKIV